VGNFVNVLLQIRSSIARK